jgi:hypothetical protein
VNFRCFIFSPFGPLQAILKVLLWKVWYRYAALDTHRN